MALSVDAARQVEEDLLRKAEVLAYYLDGLGKMDIERAKAVLTEILGRLEEAVFASAQPLPLDRRPVVLVSSRSNSDEIEDFILENLANSPRGLSVQEIVDCIEEAGFEIKRATLVVRLHRMVRAGKVTSRTHGHYGLSEAEHSRRQSA